MLKNKNINNIIKMLKIIIFYLIDSFSSHYSLSDDSDSDVIKLSFGFYSPSSSEPEGVY